MSKVRVFKKSDGSIHIAHYIQGSKTTEEEFYKKVNVDNDEYEDIDESEVPTNRTDRNAWELGADKKIKVNAVKKAELDAIKADKEADKQSLKDLIFEKKNEKKNK